MRITKGTTWISQFKVPSPEADETAFPTGDVRYGEAFPTDTSLDAGQDRENIAKTSAIPHEALPRVTSLGGGEGMDQREDLLDRDKSTDKGSDITDEMSHVLGTLGAANILSSGGLRSVFTTDSLSVATASIGVTPTVVTASGSFSTALARDLEAKFAHEDQIIREQAKRDSEIARIHAEKELEMLIIELDRNNEMVAKYLSEYEQAEAGLSHDEKVELINELLMYQRNLAQIKKYQAQQNKPPIKTERRNFYIKFIPVWEKMQDFVPMNSKLENERLKRPGIQLDKESFKKLKTAEASGTKPTQEQQSEEPKELSEEELKKMMEPEKVFDREDLDKLWSLVKETCSTTEVTDEKANDLWVELKRLYQPDSKDPLWALQRYMHDPLVWRLYDICGVHHVSTGRGHQIFMLVEKDYPLTKGLTTLMLSNKLQVDQFLEMVKELLMKIYIIANSLR
uniref:Uncharacterized protein n=1 Tax=Tanacetum cinerariifolium TaxID=118510 RepID=A0A6L2NPV2_TANCI|nr:hypothetical protein [Tanacetum cinerariifolium]